MNKKPVIGITSGDWNGIGPEIILRALSRRKIRKLLIPVVIGNSRIIEKQAEIFKIKPNFEIINIETEKNCKLNFGKYDKASAKTSYKSIIKAAELAQKGMIKAIVTAPVSKENIIKAGNKFTGHTELLADFFGVKHFTMMFVSNKLKVALVTTHLAVSELKTAITKLNVYKTIENCYTFLKVNYKKTPRIGVCGLNPHAGENGKFGNEEIKFISPAIKKARQTGIDVDGPFPADTLFNRTVIGSEFDAVVAMYHDQGLIAPKLVSFGENVNVTVGLPVVRTSVDHGVAFNIAGKNIADESSMINALLLAARLVKE